MGTPLEIHYETTLQDFSRAQGHVIRAAIRNNRWMIIPRLLFACTGILPVLGMFEIERFKEQHGILIDPTLLTRGIWLLLGGFISFLLGIILFGRILAKSQFHPNGTFLSPHTMKLTEEHVLCTTKNSHAIFPYDYILRLEEDRTLLYLFLDNAFAMVIPLRCFETTSDKQAFVDFITSRLSKEQPGD